MQEDGGTTLKTIFSLFFLFSIGMVFMLEDDFPFILLSDCPDVRGTEEDVAYLKI
jgi:hypothetical protein